MEVKHELIHKETDRTETGRDWAEELMPLRRERIHGNNFFFLTAKGKKSDKKKPLYLFLHHNLTTETRRNRGTDGMKTRVQHKERTRTELKCEVNSKQDVTSMDIT